MSGGVIARLLDVLAKPGARILQPAVKPRSRRISWRQAWKEAGVMRRAER